MEQKRGRQNKGDEERLDGRGDTKRRGKTVRETKRKIETK
jgi:hypothetical protein